MQYGTMVEYKCVCPGLFFNCLSFMYELFMPSVKAAQEERVSMVQLV